MPKHLRWLWVLAALGVAALGTFGCGLILGLDGYKEGDGSVSEGGGGEGGCGVDPTKQCIPQGCTLTTEQDLLNACTTADCVPFDDNARVMGARLPDGGLPPVPPLDSGITDAAAAPQDGAAPVACNKINNNPVVYVAGTAKPYVAALARVLFTDPTSPITVVWRGMSSCNAWDQLLNGEPLYQEPGAATGSYWDANCSADGCACVLPTGGDAGVAYPDITVTDLFAQSCRQLPNGLPSNIGDFFGPVQTMTFIVPKASSERAISATAAYYVYGFGADSGTAPWTDPAAIYRLADESGTQRLIAAGIGVRSEDWKGTNMDSSGKLLPKITTPTPGTEAKSIGPLAYTNITDQVRPQLEILAYKHYQQYRCAYFPDSTDQAKDKVNVRDGHYAIWGPIHFSTHVQNSVPTSANAAKVINMWIGAVPPPQGVDLIQIAAINNLVPECAMKVKRRTEMGPLEPAQTDNQCGCYFEKVAGQTPKCTVCTKHQDCPASAPKCNYGYCEAR